VGLRGIKGEYSLQANLVLPAGMKIIFIQKMLFDPQMQITESDLFRVITKPQTSVPGDAVGLAMNEHAVQMAIIPAHHDLDRVMEIGQVLVTGYQQTPKVAPG
jgi:hypothetical protein